MTRFRSVRSIICGWSSAAELAAASLLADRYTQLVNVYQAMGGGWVDIAGSMAPKPQGVATVTAP